MAEEPNPPSATSSRAVKDGTEDEDLDLSLVEACSSGDIATLRSILSQPPYSDFKKSEWINARHPVVDSLYRGFHKAIELDQAAAIAVVYEYTLQHDIHFMGAPSLGLIIKLGHLASFRALVAINPTAVLTESLSHYGRPLDMAAQFGRTDIVAVIFELGSHLTLEDLSKTLSDRVSSKSVMEYAIAKEDTRILELMLAHGAPVARALHCASSQGKLKSMRLLTQYGADVNELFGHVRQPSQRDPPWQHSWTPLHSAASTGRVHAMKWLESEGARPEVEDSRGMTAAQVLEESGSRDLPKPKPS